MNNSKQLSKEEIEKLLSCDNCKFAICEQCEISYTDKKKIRQYTEQLETNNQKLIDKLEKERIKNNEFEFYPLQIEKAYNNYYKAGKIDLIDEILEILKGEKNDS